MPQHTTAADEMVYGYRRTAMSASIRAGSRPSWTVSLEIVAPAISSLAWLVLSSLAWLCCCCC